MEGLERILSEHLFFAAFPKEHRELLAGCAKNHRFNAGQFVFHEGDAANEFYLIRHGKIALEIVAPGRQRIELPNFARRRYRRRVLARSALPGGCSTPGPST